MRAAGALLLATVLSGCAAGGDTPAEPALMEMSFNNQGVNDMTTTEPAKPTNKGE